MDTVLWILSLSALAGALVALRRASILAKELRELKRNHYYAENRVKRFPEELQEAVEPLRLHLARLAEGRRVPPELILNGRLYRDVSAEETRRMIEQEGGPRSGHIVLLDVRTPREYVVKHAAGARSVPFEDLEARYRRDIPDTVDKLFVYCMTGDRSRLACEFLSRKGYTNVYNVQDGMQRWQGLTEGEGQVQFIQFEPRR